MIRTSNIDIGNDSVKAIMGEERRELYIPNVIAHASLNREVYELERDIVDGIHLSITSDSISQKQGFFKVGNLARETSDLLELKSDSQKTNNDQTMILLLSTIAIDAVTCGKFSEVNGVVEASYYLSTGLPISEASIENRKIFRERLENSVHEIHFLQTPELSGRKVRIHIKKALVNIEGFAAYIYLNERQNMIKNNPILILDVGGLTTDAAVIRKNTVDNTNSKGITEGISPYIDRIIERLQKEYRYPIKNRKDLVEVITNPNHEERNHIFLKGQKTSIEHIVNKELSYLALKQYQYIVQRWESVPDLRAAFILGGGAIVLQEHLQKINATNDEHLPLHFLAAKESIWMNVLSYEKILHLWLQNQREKEMNQYAY
ncbi:ParM/StbA family protein [Heyndrickxia oleronia]|uniref:Alp7A family actin-like protein n=1 Tax=Heyndrickxia oleronia TaxID=38875 RepID=UPI00071753EB